MPTALFNHQRLRVFLRNSNNLKYSLSCWVIRPFIWYWSILYLFNHVVNVSTFLTENINQLFKNQFKKFSILEINHEAQTKKYDSYKKRV